MTEVLRGLGGLGVGWGVEGGLGDAVDGGETQKSQHFDTMNHDLLIIAGG